MFVVERVDFALFLFRSSLLGIVLALLYIVLFGFLRIALCKILKGFRGKALLVIPDLLFSMVTAFMNLLMIYVSNRGQVRISALAFEVAGFCVVYCLFSRRIERLEEMVLDFLKNKLIVPVILFFKNKIKSLLGRISEKYIYKKQKRYDRKIDRLFSNTVKDALKKGENILFLENE